MANKFERISNFGSESHFSQAVTGELAFSSMTSNPTHYTTFNAGDIVPIYCLEVLPHDEFEMSLDFVVRQNTILTPTMGSMRVDYYAFFVPNRVVNSSWKTVMGENPNGSWTAPEITLAPLVGTGPTFPSTYQVPVDSIADYYGFPTQQPIPAAVLQSCHDLKFRGYVEIYNEFFRDQNYQPPVPYSKLNIFQGFFGPATSASSASNLAGTVYGSLSNASTQYNSSTAQDNSVGAGAVLQSVYGNLSPVAGPSGTLLGISLASTFNALGSPLKANKLHDYFTSVLPSSQKGPQVLLPLAGNAPVLTASQTFTGTGQALRFSNTSTGNIWDNATVLGTSLSTGDLVGYSSPSPSVANSPLAPANLYADLSQVSSATLSDLRMAAAVQQVYEALARGGSRYREIVRVLFGLEVDNPYEDIPTLLGTFHRDLDLYQTAQTSPSESGSTPQGNLAAFGYTSNSGHLFKHKFLEHGYVHVFAVVRHKNVYSSFLARDNFRTTMLDFYQPPLANISEQPVYTREINPFNSNSSQVFGYQEPWAEYRYDPDYVSGYMRPGVSGSLALWNYADDFNSSLSIASGTWLRSNSQEVLDRSLAVTSSVAPQLKGQFRFHIFKNRPMPTYSVPGLDIF